MHARTAFAAGLAGAASVGAVFLPGPAPLTGVALADAPKGCSSASLQPVLLASGAIEDVGLTEPTCLGDWAIARTTAAPPAQNAFVLFHRVNGTWQYVTYGSALDCMSNNGVPAEIAARFTGCSGR